MPTIASINYALPPSRYFWRWSEDDSAIEWSDGETLCLREEVLTILTALSEQGGLPPLGALLLVLGACGEQKNKAIGSPRKLFYISYVELTAEVETFLTALETILTSISLLPDEFRRGLRAKTRLVYALFSNGTWSRGDESSRSIVRELLSEPPSQWKQYGAELSLLSRFLRDGQSILRASGGLDVEELKNRIETGLEFVDLAAVELLQTKLDDERERSLLDKLVSAGSELSSLASVARKVIGLISVPRPAKQAEELTIGGVADIINRGTLDKLLATELAWDDVTLATRLAQNEALYYRRETPPENTPSERIILMDHGLRYWGLLRLYSLATHLGLRGQHLNNDHITTTSYVAHPNSSVSLALESVADVRRALRDLPPQLDPIPAINDLQNRLVVSPPEVIPDLFYISSGESLENPNVKNAFTQLVSQVRRLGGHAYLITLSESGDIEFHEHLGSQVKFLQKGRLDLDELLPSKEPKVTGYSSKKASQILIDLDLKQVTGSPFYNEYPPPMLLPASPRRLDGLYKDDDEVFVGVSASGHLMRWFKNNQWAQEISYKLPGRDHWVGTVSGDEGFYVACSGERVGDSIQIFKILPNGHHEILSTEKSRHPFPARVVFDGSNVIYIYTDTAETVNLDSGKMIASDSDEELFTAQQVFKPAQAFFHGDKGMPDSLKSIRPLQIAKTYDDELVLLAQSSVYVFQLDRLEWVELLTNHDKVIDESKKVFYKTNHRRFSSEDFLWESKWDDVKVFFDPRGFLHISLKEESWTLSLVLGSLILWRKSEEPLFYNKQQPPLFEVLEVTNQTKSDFGVFLQKFLTYLTLGGTQ